ncbi:MAG: hypothetical protein ACI4MJ_02505 [Aristaeellaceae bacterium]
MPECRVTLTPYPAGREIDHLEICYELTDWQAAQGEALCGFQLESVSIPGCRPEALAVYDSKGPLPCTEEESRPYPYHWLHWKLPRATEGPVTIRYSVRPRVLDESSRCGPYFDLRNEDGGANGAGIHFLAEVADFTGTVSLHWDMHAMPEGSLGVCAWGEGDVTYDGPLEKLRQCYFAFGAVKKITEGDFGYYWLAEPTFDVAALAGFTRDLFGRMQAFFHDDQKDYRIFMRKDPFNHSGGTALQRSYMFGWNDTEPVSVKDKQNILAHEMVHNWPHLNDNPYGTSSWYSEGTAEYYCCMLPFRAGLIDRQTLLGEIQRRTTDYYTNPTRHMENMEAARICWQDRRAQRLPYGRGIFFLANTDVKLRQATGGRVSIDDVVLRIQEKDRAGVTLGNEVFLDTVRELGGIDVREDWETMRTGGHIVPLEDAFDAQLRVREVTVPEADTGVPVTSYEWSLR